MSVLLMFSRAIDRLTQTVGHATKWLILVAVLISSGNALVRYTLSTSSNAWLEAQWYLFGAVVMLCAGYTLLANEHVRIDVFFAKCKPRTQAWIDVLGLVLFLLPMTVLIGVLAWPMFVESYRLQEMSTNAGGLIRWPVKLLIPLGFLLLGLQGVSELIKRIAFLSGRIPHAYSQQAEYGADPLLRVPLTPHRAMKKDEDA